MVRLGPSEPRLDPLPTQASGLRGGTFVDASGSICSTSAVSGSTNLMLFDTGEFKLGDFRTKAKITAACDDAVSASAEDVGSTTTVTSDGSELAPYCSWSSSCSWTSSTKLKCATGLCQAAGYVAGTFVSASNNMCTSSWVVRCLLPLPLHEICRGSSQQSAL